MADRLTGALAVVGHGLAVFDLPPGGRRPRPGWQQRCTRDPDQVHRWLQAGRNLGVGCRASQVVGLDLDHHDVDDGRDGVAVFAARCQHHGHPWPVTLTVATPHGGRHLYFRVPAGLVIGSSSGVRSRLGPGIDVRGPGRTSGGYLVGPGSIVAGRPYVITHDTAIAWLPAWLAVLLAHRPRPGVPDVQTPAAAPTGESLSGSPTGSPRGSGQE